MHKIKESGSSSSAKHAALFLDVTSTGEEVFVVARRDGPDSPSIMTRHPSKSEAESVYSRSAAVNDIPPPRGTVADSRYRVAKAADTAATEYQSILRDLNKVAAKKAVV